MSGIGRELGDARRRAGISLEQAAWSTRLRADYLDALERDDVDGLSLDLAYVRGTVRTYAEYLGLDCEALVAGHRAQTSGVAVARRSRPRRWLLRVLVAVAGVIVLAVVGFAIGSMTAGWQTPWTPARAATADAAAVADDGDPAAADAAAGASAGPGTAGSEPVRATSSESTVAADDATGASDDDATADEEGFFAADSDEPLTLKLKVTGYVWMRVVVDGETVLEGLYDEGFAERFTAEETIDLRLGVGGNAEFTVNGVWYGPLGRGTNGPLNLRCDRAGGCRVLQEDG